MRKGAHSSFLDKTFPKRPRCLKSNNIHNIYWYSSFDFCLFVFWLFLCSFVCFVLFLWCLYRSRNAKLAQRRRSQDHGRGPERRLSQALEGFGRLGLKQRCRWLEAFGWAFIYIFLFGLGFGVGCLWSSWNPNKKYLWGHRRSIHFRLSLRWKPAIAL